MVDRLHDSNTDGQQEDVQIPTRQSSKDPEELMDDLTDCLAQLQDDTDIERLNRIIDELDQQDPAAPDFDAEQSLADFHEKYEHLFAADPPAAPTKRPKRRKLLRHVARIAAIIATLLILCVFAAQAEKVGFFSWRNDEQFHLSENENSDANAVDSTPDEGYKTLQAALDAYGVSTPLAPSRLPDGAALQTLSVDELNKLLYFRAKYELPDGKLFIIIEQNRLSEVEKDETDVEVYTVGGIEHYIMSDVSGMKAVWHNGVWVGRISGNIDSETLIAMIDSIYK